MDRRPQVVLRIRVVPGSLLGWRHAGARDRMPATRFEPSSLSAVRSRRGAGVCVADRRARPAFPAETPVDAPRVGVRTGRHQVGRREPARFRCAVRRSAAPARGRHARGVLPSEQGPGQRDGRRGQGDAPAAAAMKLEIVHETRYRYVSPIAETVMEVRLQPMEGNGQRCLKFDLDVSSGIQPRAYRDGYGNNVHYFNLVRPHTRLNVISTSVVETGLEPDADSGEELVQDFLRYRSPVKDVPGVRELASRHPITDPASEPDVERALDELTLTINREFAYDRAVTNVYSAVDDVLALRAGVCQDFAHLFIAVARAMGVPARYVSGYIHDPRERGVMGASHAWGEAWVPARGWVGYDATHPVRITEHHVRVAVGRDYSDAAPTRGVFVGSAAGTMNVKVRTRQL